MWSRNLVTRHPARAFVALLVFAQSFIAIGLWRAGIPLGDEGSHLAQVYAMGGDPRTWINLFHDGYRIIVGLVPDPIQAHLFYRFLLAQASVLVLAALLRAIGLTWRGTALACLLWIGCGLANPLIQFGNVNLFTFSLAGAGLTAVLRRDAWPSWSLCGALWALSAAIRPEYLLLLPGLASWILWHYKRKGQLSWIGVCLILTGSAGLGLALLSSIHAWKFFDAYLLLGLGQCYAQDYLRHHPGVAFHPFTEYRALLDTTFGHPRTFLEAIGNNPGAMVSYLSRNGVHNLLLVVPSLLNPRRAVTLSHAGAAGLLAIATLFSSLAAGTFLRFRRRDIPLCEGELDGRKLYFTLLFASPALVAILLLIPDPRYWIGVAPLLYAWAGWSLEALVRRLPVAIATPLLIALFLLLLRPMPWSTRSNQASILAARHAAEGLEHPVVAGLFPLPWQAFAFAGRGESVDVTSAEDVRRALERSDIVVVDEPLRLSDTWHARPDAFSILDPARGEFVDVYSDASFVMYAKRRTDAMR